MTIPIVCPDCGHVIGEGHVEFFGEQLAVGVPEFEHDDCGRTWVA